MAKEIKYKMEVTECLRIEIPDLTQKLEAIAEQHKNTALIQYFRQPMVVACNGNCEDVGDLNPDIVLEGGDAKLENDSDFPNNYCVRNCAGCRYFDPRDNYPKIIKEICS
jgi:hypothetical protein